MRDLLSWAHAYLRDRGLPESLADAQVLLARALGIERWRLPWSGEIAAEAAGEAQFRDWVVRRGRFEPLHYIQGFREFWSHDFQVTPEVLIPRPETEILVEEALRCARLLGREGNLNILDVGTGSANIAVILAGELPRAKIVAIDCSPGALRVAAVNCRDHGVAQRVFLLCSDLLLALRPEVRFPLIVANLPYIDRAGLDILPLDVRNYEPRVALDGGQGGTRILDSFITVVPALLEEGGFLLLEIGAGQSEWLRTRTEPILEFREVRFVRDLSGVERVYVARREGPAGG
ncbi:MAG: peptide chain release factor N(5)-glutamine methyltransferase [Candidatus Tectomicrobia bacterium]|uniref:Release factor glutamine methyltransferase n=1 Tax=Tectimicrobiota bacterium TaxID=2528274 RepID=A0A932M053_UNCTE|nr:peptide chain release factor N(5)-glutamine methyltransferase [Candidatus Tectomicrobia bacterium]